MSVVVGTAGHIDHGKTTLLRALTGIDADRLPEERRRGMTIDVGYAHLALPDGSVLDFIDVPGHDRLVGNMLVGAGEVDAALLVVAADDGPNAQTIEHLELLDAMGIADGLVAVTKSDVVDAGRAGAVMAAVDALVARTRLVGAPVIAVSGVTGAGLDELHAELVALRDRVEARLAAGVGGAARLSIDRSFTVKGRGSVVTGSLCGGSVATGAVLRLVPGGSEVRVREVQVRGGVVPASDGGRTALLVAGAGLEDLERGRVLTTDDDIVATSRVLVAVWPPAGLASPAAGSARAGRAKGVSRPAGTGVPLVPATASGSGSTSARRRRAPSSSAAPVRPSTCPTVRPWRSCAWTVRLLLRPGRVRAAQALAGVVRRRWGGARCPAAARRVAAAAHAGAGGGPRDGGGIARVRCRTGCHEGRGRAARPARRPCARWVAGGSPPTSRRRSRRRSWSSSGRTMPPSPGPRARPCRRSAPSLPRWRDGEPRWIAPPRTSWPGPWWTAL